MMAMRDPAWGAVDEAIAHAAETAQVQIGNMRLRPPDKRARQRALMHQAAVIAGELKIVLEKLEELMGEGGCSCEERGIGKPRYDHRCPVHGGKPTSPATGIPM